MGSSAGSAGVAPRILLVRVGAMGDVLHALPAAAMLRARLPDVVLGWAIEPRWTALLQTSDSAVPHSAAMPLVDCVHAVPTRAWSKRPFSLATARSVFALRRQLRVARYDLALDLQGSMRSAAICRGSGAAAVVGPATPREAPARWLYRTRVRTPATHVIEQGLELAEAALAILDRSAQSVSAPLALLPVDPAAETWAEAICGSSAFAFLAPTAGWGAKEWPAERFGAVAAALVQRGVRVVLNAQPPLPDGTAQAVLRHTQIVLPSALHGQVQIVAATLPQLIALVRRAALVVAGDTGPLHLAAALRVPVVGLFGPTDPARNGPHTANAIVLRDPASVTDHRRHRQTEAGLQHITVDAVLAAALALLPPA